MTRQHPAITAEEAVWHEVECLRAHGVRVEAACELVAERLHRDVDEVSVTHFVEQAEHVTLDDNTEPIPPGASLDLTA